MTGRPPDVERAPFGRLATGELVEAFTLRNAGGMEVRVTGFGGAIVSVRVPDREGQPGDVVLGYDDLPGYVADEVYLGALVGRYANRIRRGRFSLDGTEYVLETNHGPNHLHGGRRGFHKVLWSAEPVEGPEGVGVALRYTSPDGEEGYPGTLRAGVRYLLTGDNALVVDYHATADRPTPVNLTQHTYFNLTGDPGRDILGHKLQLHAEGFTPVDETLIPTGEIAPVAGTSFDFRRPTPIGAHLDADDVQLARAGGYDHNFVLLGRGTDGSPAPAARVFEPGTGRVLEVLTTEPGLQFYSGNFLDGSIRGKGGRRYGPRCGFCLEPQHFPDSPNHPEFPPTILRPGERYASRTVYRFGVA
ncbi:MAG TPA: aldose epimerase family protein [Longimicrobiaceae bacterium]|nr:aldose epimerase family protein [Longimicrobiaceae bacterium]